MVRTREMGGQLHTAYAHTYYLLQYSFLPENKGAQIRRVKEGRKVNHAIG
jgi:hypothetical protein